MDFFEAQARAKKQTTRLLVLFVLAVAGTIAAGYLVTIFIFDQGGARARHIERGYWTYQQSGAWPDANAKTRWWDPALLGAISIGTLAVVGLAALYKWTQYSSGGGVIAESVGGRIVQPHTTDLGERRLLNVVEEMAIASGVPVPAVYILDDETAINAFAAGLTTSDAVVAVTRGALDKLSRDELQGVIGHEFSHILNGDMRLNVRIAAIVFGILVLGLTGRGILWSLRHVRLRGRGKGAGGILGVVVALGIVLLIIGYVGYFFGRLIQAAVSRQREFLADASAVQFTRNPAGLTGTLKKIGGYALGSSLQTSKAAAIGHFFFAQAFRSGITGLWSTHPPLPERIRAIDPQFDGAMFAPPQIVDVGRQSFVEAGLVPPKAAAPVAPPPPAPLRPEAAVAALAAAGELTTAQISYAHNLLAAIPPRLRDAAHHATESATLIYALLLADDPAVRARQRHLIGTHGGAEAAGVVRELEPALHQLSDAQKLPLLQLALPSLRQLSPAALPAFLDVLDELVHADAHVSTFEFALQKLLVHTLELGRQPGTAVVQYHSFRALTGEISIVLSVLARAAVADPAAARSAFDAGAAQLQLISPELRFLDETAATLAALDTALDKLALASLPIKQRTLLAAAHLVGADGEVRITEAELLRAIAAALDVPMPPLGAA